MHNARNRRASRQPISKHQQTPPLARSARQEAEFMLRNAGTPPAFPRELILPAPQCAMNAPITLPETERPAMALTLEQHTGARSDAPETPRRPKGKKARKAAMRMAAAQARKAAAPHALPAAPPKEALPQPALLLEPAAAPADEVESLPHALALQAAPDALPQTLPEALPPVGPPAEPEPLPLFLLPPAPEPLVTSAPPIAADVPLPRSRSLVPARRQGLVDVIAFFLRDSGRRLARWSARRHKMREQYAQVYASDLRKAAIQSQLEALEALRQQQQRGGVTRPSA